MSQETQQCEDPGPSSISRLPDEGYERKLGARQVQMMAIGSAIGVGLFYGTGGAIQTAGPVVIVAFLAAGVLAFFVMRALGELLTYRPNSGSFTDYANEFMGPLAGFVTGWSYWLAGMTVCMAEVTAAGFYVNYWFPEVPVWLTAAVALSVMLSANLLSVRIFGEVEFWFASIKVIAILTLIVGGLLVLIVGITPLGHHATVTNLWSHGGFAPNGWSQVITVMTAAFFAYTGIELVGSTAGESTDPKKILRRAVNLLPIRIGVFYIGSIIVLLSLMPWTTYSGAASPYVQAFGKFGLPAAGGLMNFVVLTAALSGCNANIYVASRIVRRMSFTGEAPTFLRQLNGRRVPVAAVVLCGATVGAGILVNVVAPDRAFTYLTSVAVCGVLWAWSVILICNLRYRRAVKDGRLPGDNDFRMPWAPFSNWIALACIAFILALLARDPDTRLPLYVGAGWAAFLLTTYAVMRRTRGTKVDA